MAFLKSRIAWVIYFIGAAILFLYVLFPSEPLKDYLANQVRQTQPNLTLEIGQLKPSFPPGLKLFDVRVYLSDQVIAGFENLKISPDILSLFLSTTHVAFKGSGYGGNFKGGADIIKKDNNREIVVDTDLVGIQVDRLEVLSALTTHRISGNLDGSLTLTVNTPHRSVEGDLIITDGKVELSPPYLSQKVLNFDSIDTELKFNGHALTIERCEIEGNQLDGEMRGSIKFNPRSSSRVLDLTGTIWPHEALLTQLGEQTSKLLTNENLQTRGVPFKITGPLNSPTYSFY
jgi:type II secretion system protein N